MRDTFLVLYATLLVDLLCGFCVLTDSEQPPVGLCADKAMERFVKVRNIGKGNMGACTLVRSNDDGRQYVIKQVDLARLNKKERQQSLNEAKVLSALRHPNVINYVDSFLARRSDHLCIVMEFADGGDLNNKIRNSHGVHFSQDQVLDWAIQLALALLHIHGRRILHRDVKTQNVFLTSDGLCKLGDFGIARALSSTLEHASTFVGTPYYLSPELILERPYDAMSDVWAFGVCMYEMMALRHPFNAADMKGLMQRILRVQYDPLPALYSLELRGLVTRLLIKDPAQRMRLQDFLQQPIILSRMNQWMAGGIVPTRYLASLVRHKLLPPGVVSPEAPLSQPSSAGAGAPLSVPPYPLPPPALPGAPSAAGASPPGPQPPSSSHYLHLVGGSSPGGVGAYSPMRPLGPPMGAAAPPPVDSVRSMIPRSYNVAGGLAAPVVPAVASMPPRGAVLPALAPVAGSGRDGTVSVGAPSQSAPPLLPSWAAAPRPPAHPPAPPPRANPYSLHAAAFPGSSTRQLAPIGAPQYSAAAAAPSMGAPRAFASVARPGGFEGFGAGGGAPLRRLPAIPSSGLPPLR